MRIGCDLDGVLADLHTAFAETARRMFPEVADALAAADVAASPPEDEEPAEPDGYAPPPEMALSRRQSDAVWRELEARENFWESLGEIEPGTIRRLATLTDARGWELIFLTSRPRSAGRIVQQQSQRWLAGQGYEMPSLFVVHGSRGRIADALQLDVVIDDRPENCLDVVLESKAGAILVWRGTRGSVPVSAKRMGIAVVPTMEACLDALVAADRSKKDVPLLDRIRQIFGLRTRPAAPFLR
jgi:hypothetical protein